MMTVKPATRDCCSKCGPTLQPTGSDLSGIVLPPGGIDLGEMENKLIQAALARTHNNQSQAAKLLNLSRDAFRYRLEKLGLVPRRQK